MLGKSLHVTLSFSSRTYLFLHISTSSSLDKHTTPLKHAHHNFFPSLSPTHVRKTLIRHQSITNNLAIALQIIPQFTIF